MQNTVKKKMIVVLCSVAAILLLLVLLLNLLTKCTSDDRSSPSDTTAETVELKFSDEYVTDEAELWEDEKYLAADRTIHYFDPGTGVTVGLEDGAYGDYGACTELLCLVLEAVMHGDCETYNSFFSERYFENNEAKGEFSMQKLYDILLTPYSESEETDSAGKTYNEYIYAVEYKIRRNNGSFRSDVDSDGNRTRYFVITDQSGSLQIDAIYTFGGR